MGQKLSLGTQRNEKYVFQPKGMSQKRTCHGFQSNHPSATPMAIVFSSCVAPVQGVPGTARQGRRWFPGESSAKGSAPSAEGRHPGARAAAQPRAGALALGLGQFSSPPVP